MPLSNYLKSLDAAARQRLATACGTSVDYLFQISRGARQPKFYLAVTIDQESAGAVTFESLLPHIDWHYVRHVMLARRTV